MPEQLKRYDYIDAVRGFAILLVIAVHTSQYFNDLPSAVAAYASQGARGVQLFFVASALTLCLSWETRDDGAVPFYIRRLFRIAPMFWLAIIFFVAAEGIAPRAYAPADIGMRHIAMTATFTHGLLPDTINSVVPGGWSVADEAIFYAIFPFAVPALIRASWGTFGIVLAFAIIGSAQLSRLLDHFSYFLPEQFSSVAGVYFDLWFPRQLPCFLFGVMLFRLARERRFLSVPHARLLGGSAILLLLALPLLQGTKYVFMLGLQTTFGIMFSVFVYALMQRAASPLVNRVTIWVGKVSYSAYFVHFALIRFIAEFRPTGIPGLDFAITYAFIVTATVLISSVTYLLIEKPMIKIGNSMIGSASLRSYAEPT
jgi:peptidoglycan/LPS O-acetylase OafA/YrhL